MTKYYYGCDEVIQGWSRYFDLCNALELDLSAEKNPPTIATLNRWRVESPRQFGFILHIHEDIVSALAAAGERGSKRLPKSIDAAIEQTFERAHALAAKALIVSTPAEFTPGESSKHLLSQLEERLVSKQDKARPLIWEPSGLWQREDAMAWSSQHTGLTLAHDPFMAIRDGDPCAAKQDACFIVNERAGMRRKFDQYDFEDLLDWSSGTQRAFILLRGRFKAQHAKELHYILANEEN